MTTILTLLICATSALILFGLSRVRPIPQDCPRARTEAVLREFDRVRAKRGLFMKTHPV